MRIPIVFLTARNDSTLEYRCRLAGVAAFLTKPVMRDALLNAINAAIPKTRAETETQAHCLSYSLTTGAHRDMRVRVSIRPHSVQHSSYCLHALSSLLALSAR